MAADIGHKAPHHRTGNITIHRDIEIRIEAQPSDAGDTGDARIVAVNRILRGFRCGGIRAAQAAIRPSDQYRPTGRVRRGDWLALRHSRAVARFATGRAGIAASRCTAAVQPVCQCCRFVQGGRLCWQGGCAGDGLTGRVCALLFALSEQAKRVTVHAQIFTLMLRRPGGGRRCGVGFLLIAPFQGAEKTIAAGCEGDHQRQTQQADDQRAVTGRLTETGHFRLAGRCFLLRRLRRHCRTGAFTGFRFPLCGGFFRFVRERSVSHFASSVTDGETVSLRVTGIRPDPAFSTPTTEVP